MSNFFAYLSRMKLINRWGLMRSVQLENIQEHSHQVALIAHALAEVENRCFGGNVDTGCVVLLAMYHDVGEVIIGDLPTPVKYFNPEIKRTYGEIENIAREKLLSMLPEDLSEAYSSLFFPDEERHEYYLVKAADKLAAYVKCLEECAAGNGEFLQAKESIKKDLKNYEAMPPVRWFMENCLEAYGKTLDELG